MPARLSPSPTPIIIKKRSPGSVTGTARAFPRAAFPSGPGSPRGDRRRKPRTEGGEATRALLPAALPTCCKFCGAVLLLLKKRTDPEQRGTPRAITPGLAPPPPENAPPPILFLFFEVSWKSSFLFQKQRDLLSRTPAVCSAGLEVFRSSGVPRFLRVTAQTLPVPPPHSPSRSQESGLAGQRGRLDLWHRC